MVNSLRRYRNLKYVFITAAKAVSQKWIELKEETDKSTILIGDFSIPLSRIDRATRQN